MPFSLEQTFPGTEAVTLRTTVGYRACDAVRDLSDVSLTLSAPLLDLLSLDLLSLDPSTLYPGRVVGVCNVRETPNRLGLAFDSLKAATGDFANNLLSCNGADIVIIHEAAPWRIAAVASVMAFW